MSPTMTRGRGNRRARWLRDVRKEWATFLTFPLIFVVLVCTLPLHDHGPVVQALAGAPGTALTLILIWRVSYSGTWLYDDLLLVRGPFRTFRLRRDSIASAAVERIRWRTHAVTIRDAGGNRLWLRGTERDPSDALDRIASWLGPASA